MDTREEEIKKTILHVIFSCHWTYDFSEQYFVLIDSNECVAIIYYPPIRVGFNEDSPLFNASTQLFQKAVILFSDIAMKIMRSYLGIKQIHPHSYGTTKTLAKKIRE